MNPVIAEVVRGKVVESVHHGIIAVTRRGKVVFRRGDIDRPTVLRSTAKPMQALSVLASGAAERFGLTDAEVALVCSSHEGSDLQRATAQGILSKIGLGEADLKCGAHVPDDKAARALLAREGRDPTPIFSNCSGKHSGMLAACVAKGWPIGNYLDLGHPLQKANLAAVKRLSGARTVPVAIDGCSAPTFAIPLWRLALAFERLFSSDDPACARVRRSIAGHPEMMSTLVARILKAGGGEVLAKEGAEGVIALAIPSARIGIAIKVLDGSFRPQLPLVAAICRRLRAPAGEALKGMAALEDGVLKNYRGLVTGRLTVRLSARG